MGELIGKSLGSYRILEQIGVGGMATIYKAYQPGMDRYVAIKVLPHYLAGDKQFVHRFQREARAIAKLEHPHILPVFDYGEHEGTTYIAMRYVEAGTLKEHMAQGRMSLPEISHVIGQIGSALDYAHRQGIIHRDVKPGNILIDNQGNTYLTDFGLARIMESSQQFTASGVSVGTPAYMSPEQGKGIKVDHRSDIYSLGVMLYEMVTQQVPFEAETPLAVLLKHITDPLPLPRKVRPDIPEPVELVVLRALAKEPGDRFQSANELAQALTAAVRHTTTTDQPTSQPAPPTTKPPSSPPESEQISLITRAQHTWQTPRGKAIMIGAAAIILILFGFLINRLNQKDIAISNGATAVPTASMVAEVVETAVPTPTNPAPTPTESTEAAAEPTNQPTIQPTTEPTDEPPPTPTSIWQDVAANLTWEQVNDGAIFRRAASAIAIDPQNPDVMYSANSGSSYKGSGIGTGAGVFKSTDGGATWFPASSGLGQTTLNDIIIDPVNPDIVYTLSSSAIPYKSSDGGATWHISNNGLPALGGDGEHVFIMDPNDHEKLILTDPWEGLFVTTDGGANWETLAQPCQWFLSLVIDPRDSDHIIGGSRGGEFSPSDGCPGIVHESTNGGRSWVPIDLGVPGTETAWGSTLASDPRNPDRLYLGLSQLYERYISPFFTSADGGKSWTELPNYPTDWWPSNIIVNPNDGTVYGGGDEKILYRSTDEGRSWAIVHTFTNSITAMAFDSSGERLYVNATDVFWTDDGGQSWASSQSGLAITWLDLNIDPASGTLFAEDGMYNMYRSPDVGTTWEEVAMEAYGLTFDPQNDWIYRQSDGALFRSEDAGETWAFTGAASPAGPKHRIYINPQDENTFYSLNICCDPFIHRTTDNGQTWEATQTLSHLGWGRLLLSDDGQFLAAVGNRGGVDISDDGGASWRSCRTENRNLLGGRPPAAALHPQDNGTILVGSWGGGIFKTGDGCGAWTAVNTGLNNLYINDLDYDLQDPNIVYAGTDDGAYVSFDGGESWHAANNGLGEQPIIYSLAVDPTNPAHIFAATPNGIFRMELELGDTAVSATDEPAHAFAEPILAAIADRPPLYDLETIGLPTGTGISGHPSHADGETGFIDGEYFMIVGAGEPEAYACYGADSSVNLPTDFVLEIDGRFLPENNPENDDWQIRFRNDKYTLMISHGESLNLAQSSDNDLLSLAEHHGAPILAEPDSNFIQLIAQGTEIAVYVNENPVLYINDADYPDQNDSGSILLALCNMGITPREARWSNLKVWDITDLTLESGNVAANEPTHAFAEPILDAIANQPPDYEDDFSDSTGSPGMQTANTSDGFSQVGIVDGELFIKIEPAGDSENNFCAGYQNNHAMPLFSDLVIEVDGRFSDGFDDPSTWWSVHFRQNSKPFRRYHVVLYNDKDPKISLHASVESEIDLGRYWGAPINAGAETDHLQIVAKGSQIAVYTNGEQIIYSADNDYSDQLQEGYVTFQICSANETPRELRLDNLRVWDISDLPLPPAETTAADMDSLLEQGEFLEDCRQQDLCICDSNRQNCTPLWLSTQYADISYFSWSPDGERVLFSACDLDVVGDASQCDDFARSLFFANRDGSNVTAVSTDPETGEKRAVWSPDGEWIAYFGHYLQLIRPDGSDDLMLASGACPYGIAWSPDSQQLAWLDGPCGPGLEPDSLWVINRNGSNKQLIYHSADLNPVEVLIGWSPDGEAVAIMNEDGTSYLIDANCADQSSGCDASSRTELDAFPEHWMHTFTPQWLGE